MIRPNQWIGASILAVGLCFGVQNAYAAKTLAGQVVFYNQQVVVFDSDFLKAGNRELQVRFGKRENVLNSKLNVLRANVKKFQTASKSMSAKQREKEAKALRDRDLVLQKERNALEQATSPLKQFIDLEMTKMLRAACEELSQETGCSAVIDGSRISVMYVTPQADVSQELRKKVDALWAKKKDAFVFPEELPD